MLGIVVAIVAVIALRDPRSHVSSATGSTVVVTEPGHTTSAPRSPSTTRSGRPSSSSSSVLRSPQPASSTPPSSPVPAAGARAVPLIVLNNTTTSGLAQQAAQRFQGGGWTVTRYGNLPGRVTNVISTCAYYDPAVGTAKAAAQALQLQFPVIKRVRAKFADLPTGPVVVVLTPDYS